VAIQYIAKPSTYSTPFVAWMQAKVRNDRTFLGNCIYTVAFYTGCVHLKPTVGGYNSLYMDW
jgi:hypothetical protein